MKNLSAVADLDNFKFVKGDVVSVYFCHISHAASSVLTSNDTEG